MEAASVWRFEFLPVEFSDGTHDAVPLHCIVRCFPRASIAMLAQLERKISFASLANLRPAVFARQKFAPNLHVVGARPSAGADEATTIALCDGGDVVYERPYVRVRIASVALHGNACTDSRGLTFTDALEQHLRVLNLQIHALAKRASARDVAGAGAAQETARAETVSRGGVDGEPTERARRAPGVVEEAAGTLLGLSAFSGGAAAPRWGGSMDAPGLKRRREVACVSPLARPRTGA